MSTFETLREEHEGTRIHRAVFVSEPADVDEMVYVVIPDFDPQQKWGPCPWSPRGAILPQVGDRCLVVLDNTDAPWVVCWWAD